MGLKTFKAAAGGLVNSAVAKGASIVGNALQDKHQDLTINKVKYQPSC